jgi:membrane-bound lytic murein transglycosylase B
MVAAALLCALPTFGFAADASFATWLAGVRQEAIAQGIRAQSVDRALKGAHEIPRVLELDRSQPETRYTLQEYLDRVVTQDRIQRGQERLQENRALLEQIAQRYHVQPRFVVALWGLETDFGRVTGDYPTISALATLAYDGRRSALFRRELIAAIRIVDLGYIGPEEMRGSWAGAMGQCQFMPTSYLDAAVSYRGDGRRDIWNRREDVLASIANLLSKLGWHGDETWGREVLVPRGLDPRLIGKEVSRPLSEWRRLGIRELDDGELPGRDISASLLMPDGTDGRAFLVYDNFRSLLKWNNSSYFAISVGSFADALE